MTTIGIYLEQHDECLIGRNCLQIPEPLFHSLSIGSSSCSHVFMYWLYFLNIDVRFLLLGVIGCWVLVAHSVFLIAYHAFKIQSEMTKRCKEDEWWTFTGKSTHSSWKIRLLLIIFGTYIHVELNRVYMCPFVWLFKYCWATDTSDHWPFGLSTLRTNEHSDQCPVVHMSETYIDHIGGVLVNMLPLSAMYHGFENGSGQTKNYVLSIKE